MDIKHIFLKAPAFLQKYKYAILIVMIGIVLMAIPTTKKTVKNEQSANTQVVQEQTVEEQLSKLLSNVSGVGRVQVMLTISEGTKTIYQTDTNKDLSDQSSSISIETVIVTDADHGQNGLVSQVNPPTYLGAIVLCQGADSPEVRLAVVEAVSKITGLGADSIAVLKMK